MIFNNVWRVGYSVINDEWLCAYRTEKVEKTLLKMMTNLFSQIRLMVWFDDVDDSAADGHVNDRCYHQNDRQQRLHSQRQRQVQIGLL